MAKSKSNVIALPRRKNPAAVRPQPARNGSNFWPTIDDGLILALVYCVLRNLLPGIVWEAAAGAGHLVDALRRAGREVVATDLYPDHSGPGIARHDFLHGPLPPETCGAAMITNPPNSQLTEFMVRGVTLIDIGWPAGLVLLIRQGHHTTKGRAAAFNHAALEIKCCWRPSWKPRQPGDKQP